MRRITHSNIVSSRCLISVMEGILNVDEMIGELIERSTYLKNTDQKISVKKYGFTELLRTLQSLGLSYRASAVDVVSLFVNHPPYSLNSLICSNRRNLSFCFHFLLCGNNTTNGPSSTPLSLTKQMNTTTRQFAD